jgi:hypothetical protein
VLWKLQGTSRLDPYRDPLTTGRRVALKAEGTGGGTALISVRDLRV